MPNLTTAEFKLMFFDRAKVIKALGDASTRALSRAGAFIQRRARSSMRRRKKPSPAGTPPSAHEGGLKEFLFFGYDDSTKTVVCGPTKRTQRNVGHIQEFGGEVKPTDAEIEFFRHRIQKAVKAGESSVTVDASKLWRYPARPFMGPALKGEVAAGTVPPLWKDSIRG